MIIVTPFLKKIIYLLIIGALKIIQFRKIESHKFIKNDEVKIFFYDFYVWTS
jgi:hypothetical protein